MRRPYLLPMFVVLLLTSLLGLWRYSEGIRTVTAVSLFASGAIGGAALAGIISGLWGGRDRGHGVPRDGGP